MKFKSSLHDAFSSAGAHVQSLPLQTIVESLDSSPQFSNTEVQAAIRIMQDANQIMVAEGNVFLI